VGAVARSVALGHGGVLGVASRTFVPDFAGLLFLLSGERFAMQNIHTQGRDTPHGCSPPP